MKLVRVPYVRKFVLRHLMELYQYDTSPYEEENDSDVNEFGLYDYKYLDNYWTEEGRHAFFIMVSGRLAGFVLVSKIAKDELPTYSMSEFFVLKKYQRKGIGQKAAFEIFSMFKGKWSVCWLKANLPAQTFWLNTISQYSEGKFSKTIFAGKPAIEFLSC